MTRLLRTTLRPDVGAPPTAHPVTVLTLEAAAPGPTVVVTANVHGDEATGTGAVLGLLDELPELLGAGTVHLLPSVNPEGLIARRRRAPPEHQDLNRLFPGDPAGTPAERHAALVWSCIRRVQPDLVLDLHADGPAAVPYVIVDRAVALAGEERTALEEASRAAARATGLLVLHEYPDDAYRRFQLDRSLAGAVVNLLHRPALTVEAGPRLVLEPSAVRTTMDAVLGALTALGMADRPAPDRRPWRTGGPWRRHPGPKAGASGVLVPRVAPGAFVTAGTPLAAIRDLEGRLVDHPAAPVDGIVVSLAERAWVAPGVVVATLAVEEAAAPEST